MVATGLLIRPMREFDVEAVYAAELRTYAFPWSRGNFADSLQAGHSAWVGCLGQMVVAYAVMMMGFEEAELLNISVVPEMQRQGFGSELLDYLLDRARQFGAKRMLLEVRPGNPSGRGLYQRFEFCQIGRRRGYYPAASGREDALVMARTL
jgi:ribosomal-protein-alanine acetyltransferase